MNEILKKRIEEGANITVQNLYDYAKRTRNPKASKYDEGYLDAIDLQGDFLFREGANYVLSNQWISVEEALPEEEERVLVTHQYGYQVAAIYKDGSHSYWGVSKEAPIGATITHWMLIPQIGGEK